MEPDPGQTQAGYRPFDILTFLQTRRQFLYRHNSQAALLELNDFPISPNPSRELNGGESKQAFVLFYFILSLLQMATLAYRSNLGLVHSMRRLCTPSISV